MRLLLLLLFLSLNFFDKVTCFPDQVIKKYDSASGYGTKECFFPCVCIKYADTSECACPEWFQLDSPETICDWDVCPAVGCRCKYYTESGPDACLCTDQFKGKRSIYRKVSVFKLAYTFSVQTSCNTYSPVHIKFVYSVHSAVFFKGAVLTLLLTELGRCARHPASTALVALLNTVL